MHTISRAEISMIGQFLEKNLSLDVDDFIIILVPYKGLDCFR